MKMIYFSAKKNKCFTTVKGHRTAAEVNSLMGTDDVVGFDVGPDDEFVIEGGSLVRHSRTALINAEKDRQRVEREARENKLKAKLKIDDADLADLKQVLKGG